MYYNTFFPMYYLSPLKNLLTSYTECLFIHKSSLIRMVKFIEIQENGVKVHVHVSLWTIFWYTFFALSAGWQEGRSDAG